MKYDADDVVTGFESGLDKVTVETKSGKTSNEVVSLGGETYAYADDVKVFFVDDDEITEGDVSDIREDKNEEGKDPYSKIYFTTVDNEGEVVDLIVLVKN